MDSMERVVIVGLNVIKFQPRPTTAYQPLPEAYQGLPRPTSPYQRPTSGLPGPTGGPPRPTEIGHSMASEGSPSSSSIG